MKHHLVGVPLTSLPDYPFSLTIAFFPGKHQHIGWLCVLGILGEERGEVEDGILEMETVAGLELL